MLIYKGGITVSKGTYWNLANGLRIDITEEHCLPGHSGTAYLRIAPAFMLLLGPIIGLLYVVFLPVATIGVVLAAAAQKSWAGLAGLVSNLAYFEWRPTESYLTGEKKRGKREKKK